MTYTVRPISDRTWFGRMGTEPTRFKSKWGSTLELLQREVEALRGRDLVIEIDVSEADLRLDGTLRANAKAEYRGVVVAFESKHGPLLYRCDRFYTSWSDQGPEWQHNVRAIALTLESLRAVDRYGATETGQQYTGWKALPAGRAMPASHMTTDRAWEVLYDLVGVGPDDIREFDEKTLVKRARRAAHPDVHDGDHSIWNDLEAAVAVLGIAS